MLAHFLCERMRRTPADASKRINGTGATRAEGGLDIPSRSKCLGRPSWPTTLRMMRNVKYRLVISLGMRVADIG